MSDTTANAASATREAEELPKAQSPVRQFVKKFLRRKTAVIGFLFIVFILILAVIGPNITPYDPNAYDYSAILAGPSARHLWGTDEFGRDVFSRILAGTQLSLGTALTASIIGTAAGVVFGLIAGFFGGIVDSLIMRVCDVMFAFPGILLAIAIVAIIGPGITNIMIGVAVFTVPSFARIIRGAVLEVRGELYVRSHHVRAHLPGYHAGPHRQLHDEHRWRHPFGIIPVLPGLRRIRDASRVGRDSVSGPQLPGYCPAPGPFPRLGDFLDRACLQPVR